MSWRFEDGIAAVRLKFAVSGAMYSRALGNAAARGGGRIAPQVLSNVAAQPRAHQLPGLAEAARTPGTLTPTPQQRGLQSMMESVPWAGSEHGGAANASRLYSNALAASGRAYEQPGLASQLRERFPMAAPDIALDSTQHARAVEPTRRIRAAR